VRILLRPETRDRFASIGAEPVGSTREELANEIKAEVARMGKVIREAGIQEK
jgi:tripartite-type tricarboxylate transporter receptor subunit TctC